MEFVIAKLYKLPKIDGKPIKDLRDEKPYIKRPWHPVSKSYAERINSFWQMNGSYYKIDEEKSTEYNIKLQEDTAKREAQKQAKTLTDASVIGQVLNQGIMAVQGAQAAQAPEPKVEPKPQNVGTPQPRKEGDNANK